jgi:alcohol dehydrogenase class IV
VAQPLSFSFNSVAQEVICASDAIRGLPGVLDRLGATRAMVTCGPSILEKSDVIQRVQAALGDRFVGLFSGVAPHSPVHTLDEAMLLASDVKPDILVSVGGGSTHDTTKGIATLLGEGGRIHDHQVIFEPPDNITLPKLSTNRVPIVTVPTTMGGAELSRGAGFADKDLGRKVVVADPSTIPRSVVIDGQALATTPMNILLSTAMGQMRIAVETVYSTRHNPISDSMALHAISMLVEYLPQCPSLDLDCLLKTKTAASLASLSGVGGLGLNTATAHHVGGLFDVPHGDANAIMLPHTMRFNAEASADRQALIAKAMGVDTAGMSNLDAAMAAADAVEDLRVSLGLPGRLRDVGVPEEGLELIAAATLHDRALATNPTPVSDAGPIMSILRSSW